jgi:Filamin/ABP280 repeat
MFLTGAFNVDMARQRSDDRTIMCQYDPAEPGDYIISVKWSNEHVPGSPFHVRLFESDAVDHPRYRGATASSSSVHRYGGPNAAINGDGMFPDDYD